MNCLFLLLLAEIELLDDVSIFRYIYFFQIIEQPSALTNESEKSALCTEIFLVYL
jgi:hypothetical protein